MISMPPNFRRSITSWTGRSVPGPRWFYLLVVRRNQTDKSHQDEPFIGAPLSRACQGRDPGSKGMALSYSTFSPPFKISLSARNQNSTSRPAGLPFCSFVFPRNQVAHVDALGESGIQVFRSNDRGWFMTVKDRAGLRTQMR